VWSVLDIASTERACDAISDNSLNFLAGDSAATGSAGRYHLARSSTAAIEKQSA
jgi:hypothetical protein